MSEIKMQETTKGEDKKSHIGAWMIGMLVCTGILSFGGAVIYKASAEEIVIFMSALLLVSGAIAFSLLMNHTGNPKDASVAFRPGKFVLCFLICMLLALFLPLIPETAWPYPALFVMLCFFSDFYTGILSGTACLLMSSLCADIKIIPFLGYLIAGILIVLLFRRIDESFQVGFPLVLSEIVMLFCLWTTQILSKGTLFELTPALLILVNEMITLLLMLVILKMYSVQVIHVKRDLYLELNDPEHSSLVRLREKKASSYYEAIHVAYFCDRIGKKLGLNDRALKAAGYYHKIGSLLGDNNWTNLQLMSNEIGLPEEVADILREYADPTCPITSKEATVLAFADSMIVAIYYLLSQDPNIKIDYSKLTLTVFQQKEDQGILKHSQISFAELEEMKQIFIEEKLYYDFLR